MNCTCRCFAAAIAKYGYDNFIMEILETNLSLDDANKMEEFYIWEHGTLSPNGYNLRSGGKNHVATPSTRKKMSNSRMGICLSSETKDKMSSAKLGKPKAPTHIKNMCRAKSGKNNPSYGKRGEHSKKSKKYIVTFPDGRTTIITGLREFCILYGLSASCMGQLARGIYEIHKGFRCEYFIE
jgi:group I intron endonuclease